MSFPKRVWRCFWSIFPNFRNREGQRIMHPLHEVLVLVTCATIASCDDFDDIVRCKEDRCWSARSSGPKP
jgi:hypothetical protein